VQAIAERLLYWMWDSGLTVGCATRTIEETISLGREDRTVRTAVLMARFLCGDGEFFHDFADTVRAELLPDPAVFVADQEASLRERHERMGESLFLLQPNVKEGAGALRDYHTAYWSTRGAQPSVRDFDDLLHFGLLTEAEMVEFREALEFLWRTRNELHLISKRCNDQMSFELQEQIAEALGYGSFEDVEPVADGEPLELPVERFMRDYYRHARSIQNYSELVIEQCHARVAPRAASREVVDEIAGFRLVNGHLEIPHSAQLRGDNRQLLRVFAIAQQWDVPLSRMARRLVRENLDLVDDAMRSDPECAEIFLSILDAERRVMRTLMTMNEVGLLGAFLPEWEHIVCRWQHVIYHTYTVDVHSIFLVEELRRLYRGKYETALPELTQLIREVEDRPALYLGCLLHDIGKGFGGDHSSRGAKRAEATIKRLGLEPERAARVIFLVQHHLQMSHLAQRRDLSDPRMLLDFAKLNGDRTNLRNLYLTTFADIRASSRDAWTDWKGSLLLELFERGSELLETGADNSEKAMELIDRRVAARQHGASEELRAQGVGDEKIEAFFGSLPRRYFVTHTPRQMARHTQLVQRCTPDRPLVTAFREMRGGFTELLLCTRDVHGLYARVAGTLTACGLNILGSHVYTTREGLALEVYRLTTPEGGREELNLIWAELDQTLAQVLRGETDVGTLLKRRRTKRGIAPPRRGEAPSVTITNQESDFYTLVDITANDRIGLLYDLTRTVDEQGFEIFISKAATIRDQAADTFYLKDAEGNKIRDPDRLEALRLALEAAVAGAEREAPAAESSG
jgi:[protein-PII] uridylyltransferase